MPTPTASSLLTIGCVSYLNAKPLIEGLDEANGATFHFDVPSALLTKLEADEVDLALLPVIDYTTSAQDLVIIPAGGIGCDGPTHTVKLFSQQPIASLDRVRVDPDSHTSVALLRILMHERYGKIIAFDHTLDETRDDYAPAMLLIGDKVELAPPEAELYPHTLDLGQAWKELTGLPFVFAVWMAKVGRELGDLPQRLTQARQQGQANLEAIIEQHALPRGYDPDTARHYLGTCLRYEIGPRQVEAMTTFWRMAQDVGCAPRVPLLRMHGA